MSEFEEKPLHIAQIVGKWVGGGVEAIIMNYYRNINHKKIQFDFICDSDSTNIPYEEIKKYGGKVIIIPPYQKAFSYHKNLKKILKNGNYKIVHSHINTLSVFSLFAAKCAKIPVRIAHSHSTTNSQEKLKNSLKNILKPFNKLFATHYMSCTEHAGRWMFGNKEFDKGSVGVLNNAVDVTNFSFKPDVRSKIRHDLGIGDNQIVVGHVGRFVEQKNHSFLIDIFSEYLKKEANSILLLVGQGPLQDDIKNKVKNLNLNEKVIFLGQRDDVNNIYQAMDFFIFPSLYEGLGMVLIEAQIAGCMCLASNEVPSIAKISDNLVFLPLDNPKKWSENMEFSQHGRKSHHEEAKKYGYDIKNEVKKLENYYLSLGENKND